MGHFGCLLHPLSCVAHAVVTTVVGGFFNTLTTWILNSVGWFLAAVGAVLNSATEPTTIIRSATTEFNVLVNLSPALLMVGLLVATLQAVRHGDAASLWRVYLGVAPACVLGIFVARPFATLILETVNQLSSSTSSAVLDHQTGLTNALSSVATGAPAFALFVLAVAVVIGSWLLWCEFRVRPVLLPLLLVLVPVIVPLPTFPAGPCPGREERADDLGLGMWEGGPEAPMPVATGVKLPPPVVTPTPRGGHVAYRTDEMGPVVGWHFDE